MLPGPALEPDQLLEWFNECEEDPIMDTRDVFEEVSGRKKLLDIMKNIPKAKNEDLPEDDQPTIETLVQVANQLDIAPNIKLKDLAALKPEAVNYFLTEVYGNDLPDDDDLLEELNDLAGKKGPLPAIDNLEQLAEPETLVQILEQLDPNGLKTKAPLGVLEPKEAALQSLQKQINIVGLPVKAEELTLDQAKVLIKKAREAADEDSEPEDVGQQMEDAFEELTGKKILPVLPEQFEELKSQRDVLDPLNLSEVQKGPLAAPKIPPKPESVVSAAPPAKPQFKKVSLAQLRDTCLLAKLMNRIYPGCFQAEHRVHEYLLEKSREGSYAAIRTLNYNACCRVLWQKFKVDVRGVSGRDLLTGDLKYLSGIVWRLAGYEVQRIDKVCREQRQKGIDEVIA